MNISGLLPILISVAMSAVAQLTLKIGMSKSHVVEAIARNHATDIITAIATSPHIIGGLTLYVLSTLVWLSVLAKLDLSVAYPFVGLGFIATMFLGMLVLGEQVTPIRVAGTLLIFAGCALVARSA